VASPLATVVGDSETGLALAATGSAKGWELGVSGSAKVLALAAGSRQEKADQTVASVGTESRLGPMAIDVAGNFDGLPDRDHLQ